MIVPFAIDPDALACSSGDLGRDVATHRRLIEKWRHVGLLVHGGSRFENSELASAVSALPQQLKLLWQKAVRVQRLRSAGRDWTPLSAFTSQTELTLVRDRFDLGCLEDTRAACLDIPFDRISILAGGMGPEICRFCVSDQAEAFVSAVAAADNPIPKGTPTACVWHQRFEPAARSCTRGATVIDRYAVMNHLQRSSSGLERFLMECQSVLRNRTVTLFTAYDDDCDCDAVVNAVRHLASTLDANGVRQIALYVGHQSVFKSDAHYRYVRFDTAVCELDIGLGVLAGNETYSYCKYRFRAATDADREEEARLREQMRFVACPCASGAGKGRGNDQAR